MFMGIDQYGETYHGLKKPRRDLLRRLGYKHASKMYRDSVSTGASHHVGYVIGRRWITIYRVEPARDFTAKGRRTAESVEAPDTLTALETMVRVFNVSNIEPIKAFVAIEKARDTITKARELARQEASQP